MADNAADALEREKAKSRANLQKVVALQREKRNLHGMMKRFEREFEQLDGRPVRTIQEITSVQDKYDRYKQLKSMLGE